MLNNKGAKSINNALRNFILDYEKKVKTMMVNNPTIPEHKKTTTFDVGNPCPGLGHAQKCGVGG